MRRGQVRGELEGLAGGGFGVGNLLQLQVRACQPGVGFRAVFSASLRESLEGQGSWQPFALVIER